MPQGMKRIVKAGVEAVTRGTAAASLPMHINLMADLNTQFRNHNGRIVDTARFPYVGDEVPLGSTIEGITLAPEANINQIKDLVLLALKRSSGDQSAISIEDTLPGVTGTNPATKYLGVVCRSAQFSASRSATPDIANLVSCSMEFNAMGWTKVAAGSAGTQATGRHFQMRHSTFTINGVSETEILSMVMRIANVHAQGPVDSSNMRLFAEDGLHTVEVELVARFKTIAWRDQVLDATEHAGTLVLATGTANETLTLPYEKAQTPERDYQDQDGIVTQRILLYPFYGSSGGATIVPAFGSAIGASALGLS